MSMQGGPTQLADEFSEQVQSTLQQASSPKTAPEFAAAFRRAQAYSQAPVPAAVKAVLKNTVDVLTGQAYAPSQVRPAIACRAMHRWTGRRILFGTVTHCETFLTFKTNRRSVFSSVSTN